MDKFTVYCHRIEKALKAYKKICDQSEIPSDGLKKTIYREATPFIKGHFTLAVIGKMSSGKSTFINALLGNRSLLPTAYEQTTCTLTEIEYGEEVQIQVIYGDNSIKKFTDANELLQTAAIPVEYQQLPVNKINKLILAGESEDKIVNRKTELDEIQGINIETSLLRRYIKTHSKNNIPTRVLIKYPLPEFYRGWRIVDTPGVSALGGIEEETREFLNGKNEFGYNNVDAIIFVNSGRNQIEDFEFKKFVDQTFLNISPETKKRIFMVITCAADNQFVANKTKYLETAKHIFVTGKKIKEERLLCIDSLCHLFSLYAINSGKPITSFKKKDIPIGWDSILWNLCLDIRNVIEADLRENDREINNETLIEELKNISGFKKLQCQLDKFIVDEKSKAFNRIMNNINKDCTSILNDIKQKKNFIEKSIGNESLEKLGARIKEVKNELESSREKFNTILNQVRDKFSKKDIWNRFEQYKSKMLNLRTLTSIEVIKIEAEYILEKIEIIKTNILDDLSSTLDKLWNSNTSFADLNLRPIDFDNIKTEAENNNVYITGGELTGYEKKRIAQQGFWGKFKRMLRIGGYDDVNDYTKPKYSKTEKHINQEKAAHEFANKIYADFSKNLSEFIDEIVINIRTIGVESEKEANEQIRLQKESYEQLEVKNQTLENKINNVKIFNDKINIIQNEISEIKQFDND